MVQAAMTRGREARASGGFQQHKLAPYAFISPFYVLFGFFFLAPSLIALVLSLFRWDGINDPRFVLARNYGRLAERQGLRAGGDQYGDLRRSPAF